MSAGERGEKPSARPIHNVIMESRRMLSLSGVQDVDTFNEQTIVLYTELGELTVRGFGLHISHFDSDTGEMTVDGEISELSYAETEPQRKGFLARLLS